MRNIPAVTALVLPCFLTAQPSITVHPCCSGNFLSPVTISWSAIPGAQGYRAKFYNLLASATTPAITQNVSGGGTTTLQQPLAALQWRVEIEACGAGFTDASCVLGQGGTQPFAVSNASTVLTPAHNSTLTTSTNVYSWPAFAGSLSHQLFFYRGGSQYTADSFPASILSVPYTLPSGGYRMIVQDGGRQEVSEFRVNLGPIPTAAPTIATAMVTNGNILTTTFSTVAGADFYDFQAVQNGGGPFGGPLSVAAKRVSASPVVVSMPAGPAQLVVAGCNADGCGPYSPAVSVNVAGPGATVPVLSSPVAGHIVRSPLGSSIQFAWNRVAGDNGTNTIYRLYLQDMVRQRTALNVFTRDNYFGAILEPYIRYDAMVIANPGPNQVAGPPSGFIVDGPGSPLDGEPVQPGFQETIKLNGPSGDVLLGWRPGVPNDGSGQSVYSRYRLNSFPPASTPSLFGIANGLSAVIRVEAGRLYSGQLEHCWQGRCPVGGSSIFVPCEKCTTARTPFNFTTVQ